MAISTKKPCYFVCKEKIRSCLLQNCGSLSSLCCLLSSSRKNRVV